MAVPEEDAERLPILGSVKVEGRPTETIVYARRWWVLVVFSLASFVQVFFLRPDMTETLLTARQSSAD